MKVYAITETLLAEGKESVTELYTDKEKAFEKAEALQKKYDNDGFLYRITAMEVKQ